MCHNSNVLFLHLTKSHWSADYFLAPWYAAPTALAVAVTTLAKQMLPPPDCKHHLVSLCEREDKRTCQSLLDIYKCPDTSCQ